MLPLRDLRFGGSYPVGGDVHRRKETREQPRDAGVPGRGAPAAAVDGPLDLLEQGHLPARADLQRLRRPGQAAAGVAASTRTSRSTPPTCTSRSRSTQEARTLTVRDNGIGMSRDEVVELIGTIAKSGTAELLRKLKESQGRGRLAGADRAVRRRLLLDVHGGRQGHPADPPGRRDRGHPVGVHRRGHLHIETVDDAPQGTAVTVHLKPEDSEDQLLRLHRRVEDPGDRQAVLRLHRVADPDGRRAPTPRATPTTARCRRSTR